MQIITTTIDSPIGPLCAGARDDGVCLLEFTSPERLGPQLDALRRTLGGSLREGDHACLQQLRAELTAYFAGRLRDFTVPLVAPGTPFQERVWSELRQIPYGQTCSYEDLARRVSTVTAQRAVGRANGSNRIAIVIPCHRVVNKSGGLGGYGGGLWRKEALLRLEGAMPAQLASAPSARAGQAAESKTGSALVATLWQLAWEGNHVACVVYRTDRGFELSVESPTAVVITERFDLEPRALARAKALRDALKRRGWTELSASSK